METEPRRVAATLPRGDPRIDRITYSISHDATLWLSGDGLDGDSAYLEPDGYEVAAVWVTGRGKVAVDVEREEP